MKKTVTGFILFAAGVAFLLFGFFFAGGSGSREADLRIALSEVENLTDDRVGQTVKLKLTEEQQYMDNNNYLAFCMNGERTTMLRIRVGRPRGEIQTSCGERHIGHRDGRTRHR